MPIKAIECVTLYKLSLIYYIIGIYVYKKRGKVIYMLLYNFYVFIETQYISLSLCYNVSILINFEQQVLYKETYKCVEFNCHILKYTKN